MKKLLSIGLLTVCAFAISEHQAQAWLNSKFNIGLSWNIQSGNNNFLWGVWKNGQVPGPEAFGGGGGGQFGPLFSTPPAGYGQAPQQMPQAYPSGNQPPQAGQQQTYYGMPYTYSQNPYQTVGYQSAGYYSPSYYYPNYYQNYSYVVPNYWYQGR
jgi:hypothetical protein